MTSTMTTTATLETLTAEVRVLTLDSRRITLTIARQLDIVSGEHLEAMGRVTVWDGRFLIGRCTLDGTLALARMPRAEFVLRHQQAGNNWTERVIDRFVDPDEVADSHERERVARALPLIVLGR